MAFVMFYRDEATLSIPKKVSHNIVILIKNAFAILIQRRFFIFLIQMFCLEYWYYPEVHSTIFSWQLIFLQWFRTPAINTAHTAISTLNDLFRVLMAV